MWFSQIWNAYYKELVFKFMILFFRRAIKSKYIFTFSELLWIQIYKHLENINSHFRPSFYRPFFAKHKLYSLRYEAAYFYNTQYSRSCMFTLKQMCKSQDHTFGYFYRFGIFTTASYLLYMVLMEHFSWKKLHTYT